MKSLLTIAVTGLNATDNPGPGVAVARALRESDRVSRLVGLVYDSLEPGIYQEELFDDIFLIPYPSAGQEAVGARLMEIVSRVGVDVIIPTLDSELSTFVGLEEALGVMGAHLFLPSKAQLELRSKAKLARFGGEAGVPVPETLILSEPEEVEEIEGRMGFPVAMKGAFYDAKIVHNVHEAINAYHALMAKWGGPIVAQAFIDGEAELNVVAVGDGEGGLVGAVPMKKKMLTDKGKGWAGVAILDEALMEITRDFMAASKWRGPCEIEVIRSKEGENFVIEINPRFPAWSYLAAGAGMNLPLAVAKLALGEEVAPLTEYRPGTLFVRISLDQIVDVADFGQLAALGELTRWMGT